MCGGIAANDATRNSFTSPGSRTLTVADRAAPFERDAVLRAVGHKLF